MTISALRLAVLGAMTPGLQHTREDIEGQLRTRGIFSKASGPLSDMAGMGLVTPIKVAGRRQVHWSLTPQGEARRPATYVGQVVPPRRIDMRDGTYTGAELRPFTGRPGAMDAYTLPSRGFGKTPPTHTPEAPCL